MNGKRTIDINERLNQGRVVAFSDMPQIVEIMNIVVYEQMSQFALFNIENEEHCSLYKKKMSQVTRSTSGKSEHCSGKGDNHDSQLWVYKYS